MIEDPSIQEILNTPKLIKNLYVGQLLVDVENINDLLKFELRAIDKLGVEKYRRTRERIFVMLVELSIRFRHELFSREIPGSLREKIERIRKLKLDFSQWPQRSALIKKVHHLRESLRIPAKSDASIFVIVNPKPISRGKSATKSGPLKNRLPRRPPRRKG